MDGEGDEDEDEDDDNDGDGQKRQGKENGKSLTGQQATATSAASRQLSQPQKLALLDADIDDLVRQCMLEDEEENTAEEGTDDKED